MKSFFALGALATLFQSAYCLAPGAYIIDTAKQDGLALTQEGDNTPLRFTSRVQFWDFTPTKGGYFEIRHESGAYINCDQTGDRICFPGDRPQAFLPEFQGENKYELVEQGSGLFLRFDGEGNLLKLAEYDQSIEEQFALIPLDQ
ncbi:uncharacterized protein N7529_009585 [Penicillium soppii]|jgi:hypothetical protein|uniref:uncharacterized protein n=1 Tax=Penicillium soppii TaxID=69789 RepID=UPI00254846E0|nr:uncharacterized protein N7529_009585 [Penicillium soppii]KAJ5855641.1 hypothetical protein N7529_009585 [Penicillium soppii]